MVLQIPAVQTGVARRALGALTENLNADIQFSKVQIEPFNTLILSDAVLIDKQPIAGADTVISAGSVIAKFSLKGLISKKNTFRLKSLRVADGSFFLVTDSNKESNLTRIFGKTEDPPVPDLIISAHKVDVSNVRFRMKNFSVQNIVDRTGSIDFLDMDLIASVKASDVKFDHGKVTGDVDHIEAVEKCGYILRDFSCKASVGDALVQASEVKIKDDWSDIYIPFFSMEAPIKQYITFTDSVKMQAQISDSKISSKTLAAFAGPALANVPVTLNVKSAEASGPVNNLDVRNLTFVEECGVGGNIRASAKNLAVIDAPKLVDFALSGCSFSAPELQALLKGILGDSAPNISKLGGGRRYAVDFKGSGSLDNLVTEIVLNSGTGKLNAHANVRNLTNTSPIRLNAVIDTKDLNIGEILGTDSLGEVSLHTDAKAVLAKGNPQISIDSLSVSKLNALGYDYSGIAAAGDFEDGAFNGKVVCGDPNLHFIFQGLINLSPNVRNALYKFYFNLGYADLNALNIDKRGASKVSMALNANYMRIQKGDLIGNVDINGLYLENDLGAYDIGDISITSHSSDNLNRMNLASRFAEASYVSNRPITDFPDALQRVSTMKSLPVLYNGKDPGEWHTGDEYSVDINFFDTHDILSYLRPGLYLAEGSTAKLDIDKNGKMDVRVKSQRVALEDNYLRDLELVLNNSDGFIGGQLTSDEISVASVVLHNNTLLLGASDDRLDANFRYGEGDNNSHGEVSLSTLLARSDDGSLALAASLLPGLLREGGLDWTISPAEFTYEKGRFNVDGLKINGGQQALLVDGGFSKAESDTLRLDLQKFNLGIISQFIKTIDVTGEATGYATLTSPFDTEQGGLLMNIVCDSTAYNGKSLGQLQLSSTYNDRTKAIDAVVKNVLNGESNIDVAASYHPDTKAISAKATLDGFDLGYFDGIAPDVFSEMKGKVNGTFFVEGTPDNPHLSSEDALLDNVLLRVAFTNVPYFLNGPFELSDTGVNFNQVTLKDSGRGTGRIVGGIQFNQLKDIRMNMRFVLDRMQAIDMSYSEASPIYGRLAATGNVRLTGPFNNLLLSVDATPVQSGQMHISLGNIAAQANSNLLTFKQPEQKALWTDPYETYYKSLEQSRQDAESEFNVRLNVNVTPETEVLLELDKEGSNSISCFGQGTTAIDIGKDLFTINGDYTINNGLCHFGLMNVALRDFTIRDGSTIKFNGDIMDSDLDIDAVYTTKASLAGLIADTTSVATRRTVECTLNIYDKLSNPQLGFAIDIPDIDPTTRASVESALNTDDKIQKQFVALLVGNSFIPDEQYGIVNTSSILYSNVAGIMASQLSNVLQRLNIPLDLGLKYEPNEGGTDIFDVAVSTELFNNRVVVNGAIGNRMYGNNSTSDVVGDLDIEIKLNRTGAWRLTLFSHSADQYSNYLDDSQRNGIGMAYQKEFDTFRDFFNSIFKRRKEQNLEEDEEEHKTTFSIE